MGKKEVAFESKNPGLVDDLIHQSMCTQILDELYKNIPTGANPLAHILINRLPLPKDFEKDAIKHYKSPRTDHPGIVHSIKSELLYKLRPHCDDLLFTGKKGDAAILPRVKAVFEAYISLSTKDRIAYVAEHVAKYAQKPPLGRGVLSNPKHEAYAWLHPEQFECIRDPSDIDEWLMRLTPNNETEFIHQEIASVFRIYGPDLEDTITTAMGYTMDVEWDVDALDRVMRELKIIPKEVKELLGFPLTDNRFRAFAFVFQEDKAAMLLTHESNEVAKLAKLCLEYGTLKVRDVLKKYMLIKENEE